MQAPAERGEQKPDRPPARAKQGRGAAQRAAHRDVGSGDGPAVLAEQGYAGEEGAPEGKYQSDFAHWMDVRPSRLVSLAECPLKDNSPPAHPALTHATDSRPRSRRFPGMPARASDGPAVARPPR